jgi:hypothetical protein
MSQLYVFGYGSLMNPKSLAHTIPGEKVAMRTHLKGYQRRLNVRYGDYLYLNLAPRQHMGVSGVLIPVTPEELEALKKREYMYECVDVTTQITDTVDGIVYAFIAPDISIPELKVPRSYILTCLAGVEEAERGSWLSETILENEIEEDVSAPVYEFRPQE